MRSPTVAEVPRPWWSTHLRGHVLRFDRRPAPAFSRGRGARLVLAAAALELVRVAAVRWLYPGVPLWVILPALLALALVAVPGIAGLKLTQLGLRPWRAWSATERSYFLQVIVIANVIFPSVLGAALRARVAEAGIAWVLLNVIVPYFVFGFYQELVYRGMIQVEAARRWGAPAGILVANVLYTFGPLHAYYFASPPSVAAPMFTAIFAIGLFFGVVYHRSGNLWIVATFHAIGNAYMIWGWGAVR